MTDTNPQIFLQTGVKQDDSAACYAAKLSKVEAKINWRDSAQQIEREIRAYNSWPVAYCQYEKNEKLSTMRVWQSTLVENTRSATTIEPGTVIAESSHGIDVQAGEGVLRITRLQVEGKRQMPAADFLNANTLIEQVLV